MTASRVPADVEHLTRAELAALQWRLLREQVDLAWRSPFYGERFAAAGLSRDGLRDPGDLASVPLTRKADVCADVAAHPPYGSRLAVDPGNVVSIVETSGTSGRGTEVHCADAGDLRRIVDMEIVGFRWAGIREATVVLLTMPVTMTAASTWWSRALGEMKANWLRAGHLSTEDKLRYAMRYQAEAIIATPTYLTRLEHAAVEMGVDPRRDLPSLRSIVVAGEPRPPAWTAEREAVWGATVYEQWGCTQGAVAWSCEGGMAPGGRRGMLHTLPWCELVEVVDAETGRHVADGEVGELVVTPLGVNAAPLVRFATGDRVRFRSAGSCACGRPYDGIEAGSVTRYDDMVKIKGVNVWPSTVDSLIDGHAEVAEHRVTLAVDGGRREVIRVEVQLDAQIEAHRRGPLLESLGAEIHSLIGLHVEMSEWSGAGDLADEVLSGVPWKARRWRDLREPS